MYVLPKEKYKALLNQSQASSIESPVTSIDSHSTNAPFPTSLCSVCGLDFKHLNILAYHMKSHVVREKCNICGKTFKHKRGLRRHLLTHRLQAGPPVEPPMAAAMQGEPLAPPQELHCSICNKKMNHERNLTRHISIHKNTLKFKATKWETLN